MRKKIKTGKLVNVIWFDACDIKDKDIEEYKFMKKRVTDGTEFLVKNSTKGLLKDVFKKVVILEIESSDDDSFELIAIPRSQIISPEYLQEDG